MARKDESSTVRSQLACTAKRLSAGDGLAIVRELLQRKVDLDDPHIPLLLWWAIEDKAISDRDQVLGLLDSKTMWSAPLMSPFVVERLARRFMAEGSKVGLEGCGWLLENAGSNSNLEVVMRGIEKALDGRTLPRTPPELNHGMDILKRAGLDPLTVTRFKARLGDYVAFVSVMDKVTDTKLPDSERLRLVELLSQSGASEVVGTLLTLIGEGNSPALRSAALVGLQPFSDPKITDTVLSLYPRMPVDLKSKSRDLLVSRAPSALALLKAVDAKTIDPKEVPFEQLRRMRLLKNADLDKLIEKHWGKIGSETTGEKTSRIRSIGGILRGGNGDAARGKLLFKEHCANCHQLFGEGNKVGPDLTSTDRKNRDYLITQIVDPSAIIRPEFLAYNLTTTDGRTLMGLIAEETPNAVTLLDAKNEKTVIPREKIDELRASAVSLMPDGLFDKFSEEMLRDLFVYLQKE
jgi:putative heme-binding domain-containing protein